MVENGVREAAPTRADAARRAESERRAVLRGREVTSRGAPVSTAAGHECGEFDVGFVSSHARLHAGANSRMREDCHALQLIG